MILYRVEITNGNTDPKENSWAARWFSKLEEARKYFKGTPKHQAAYLDRVWLGASRTALVEMFNLADACRMDLPVEEMERREADHG